MNIFLRCSIAALAASGIPSFAAAQSPAWKSAGTMDCTIGTSIGAAAGARQHARCDFKADIGSAWRAYFARLERTDRRAGLPAGAKLMWTTFTPSGDAKTVLGRYRLAPAGPQFEGRDAYTLCQPAPSAICLRPLPADVHWRPNFAATVSAISFENNPGQRRKRASRQEAFFTQQEMSMRSLIYISAFAALLVSSMQPSNAQSISYSDALGRLGRACGQDIAKYCKSANLGGGRVTQCLEQNSARVSAGCKASAANMRALLATRTQARASVMKICDNDIRRLCAGVQPGDGNLMECFYKAKRNTSAACQKVVADAGYEASVDPNAATSQVALSPTELITSLQTVESSGPRVTAASLRQMAAASLNDPSRASRTNRAPLSDQLEKQAQITIPIQFDYNSARIRPDSFQAVGLMADSLYHPYLQGYRFLVVGHTDAPEAASTTSSSASSARTRSARR